MLFPHDWRDLPGAVRARVTVVLDGGRRHELWARVLAAAERGRPRGYEIQIPIPAATAALELSVETAGPRR